MLRITENTWVYMSDVITFWVQDGKVKIHLSNGPIYTVEDEYVASVCSSLNIPYNVVQGLLAHVNTNT